MQEEYSLRCVMCGSSTIVPEHAVDQIEIVKSSSTYICPQCSHRVKYESDKMTK